MNHVLQKLIDTIPIYKEILNLDIAYSVSDMEKYLYLENTETMKFPFEVGTRVDVGGYDSVLNAIKASGKAFINYVPREVTGSVPIKAVIAPVLDNGEMVGMFSISVSMDKEEKIEKTSEELKNSIEQIYELIDNITKEAEGLTERMSSIQDTVREAVENIQKGNESIQLIKGIAKQSGFLGINAAIVSAKSGEEGRGFSVVASEMRKLAAQSTTISEQVVVSLKQIEESINEVLKHIDEAKEMTQGQYNEIDNVRNCVKLVSDQSVELAEYSK